MNFHLHLRDIGPELRVAAKPRTARHRTALRPAHPSPAVSKAARPARAPLSRFFSPSAHESGGVHSIAFAPKGSGSHDPKVASAAALPQPLCSVRVVSTTSTACSAIHSCPGFPGSTLVGLDSPFRVFPTREGRAVTGTAFPSWPFSLRSCLRSRSRLHRRAGPPGVCSDTPSRCSWRLPRTEALGCSEPRLGAESTVVASVWFPSRRDSLPHGLLLVGPITPEGARVPSRIPNCERAPRHRPEERCRADEKDTIQRPQGLQGAAPPLRDGSVKSEHLQ